MDHSARGADSVDRKRAEAVRCRRGLTVEHIHPSPFTGVERFSGGVEGETAFRRKATQQCKRDAFDKGIRVADAENLRASADVDVVRRRVDTEHFVRVERATRKA